MRQQLVLVFSTLWFLSSAAAQSPALTPMSPELKAFVMRPEQQKAINESSVKAWFQQLPNCADPKMKQRNVLIDQEPKFDAKGDPLSGQWRVVTWIEGCGEERIINLQYWFRTDGKLTTTVLLPGTSHANLILQKDAIFYALQAMVLIAPRDCKEAPVINTKFIGRDSGELPEAKGAVRQPWTEEWTVRLCGVSGAVPMHFVPDATGTTIHSEVLKASK
ncbi:MAG: hypothetical protein ABSF16_17280 [Terracidiphilus sp.]